MMRLLALGATCALFLASCGGEGSDADVEMTAAHLFDPATFTVQAGETIVFENTSSEAHTVTAYEDSLPDGATYFASGGALSEEEARDSLTEGLLKEGETFEVTLDEPGTYEYFCIPHEGHGMKGTIVVEG